jgi:hypothetical protein
MFAAVQRIAGAHRAYPVNDRVTAFQVLDSVRSADPPGVVHTVQWRDLPKIDSSSTVIAVNPAGRQSHLVLSTIGGRCAAFLVHAPSQAVELVPLRFSRTLHAGPTVMKVTVCARDRMLVVNDVCGQGGAISERMRKVHDIVHSEHVPDAAIFPLRVVARRCFSLAQLSDAKRFVSRGDVTYHSISLIGPPGSGRELRVPVGEKTRAVRERALVSHAPARSVGDTIYAPVIAAQGPDAYKIQFAPGDEWQYLTVKTIEESSALAQMDLSSPKTCQFAWDGSTWRIVMCAPPMLAHGSEDSGRGTEKS